MASNLNDLARLYQAQGKYAEAESLYQRALVINEKALGPEHPTSTSARRKLAELRLNLQKVGPAWAQAQLALESVERYLSRLMPVLSEAERFLVAVEHFQILELLQHRRNQLSYGRMNVNRPRDHSVGGLGVHHVQEQVYGLVPVDAQDRSAENLLAVRIDQDLD